MKWKVLNVRETNEEWQNDPFDTSFGNTTTCHSENVIGIISNDFRL